MKRSLLSILRLGLGTTTTADEKSQQLLHLSIDQWREMMALAEQQGVLAIVVDGLQS